VEEEEELLWQSKYPLLRLSHISASAIFRLSFRLGFRLSLLSPLPPPPAAPLPLRPPHYFFRLTSSPSSSSSLLSQLQKRGWLPFSRPLQGACDYTGAGGCSQGHKGQGRQRQRLQ
jgi:hypothetical protein